MSGIDLGFVEECEPWQVESYQFPSKVGGKPAWLSLENLPTHEQLQCKKCNEPLIFLCQIYAPVETDLNNFHRTIFVFVCRNSQCNERNNSDNIKVFRSSLKQQNQFYSSEPPKDEPDERFSLKKWLKLCDVCGCLAQKHCSQCKNATYCNRTHQIIDWKEKHKNVCNKDNGDLQGNSKLLFPEWELVIEAEDLDEKEVNEEEELMKFKQLQKDNKTGTMVEIDEDELESNSAKESDKTFAKFRKRVGQNPDQVLRYHKNGNVLWVADTPIPTKIPSCGQCGAERIFEFQIMPQMLTFLKENDLDWGTLVVYTCKNSCTDSNSYVEEFVFKQDVSLKDVV